jgi:hypothetical protein
VSLDLAAINAALYAVIKLDAAGAPVRAQLGPATKADGVLPAHQLRKPLPARPFLVWRGGVVGGSSEEMRGVVGTWWVYDDPGQGYVRITTLIGLIEAAYTPLEAVLPFGRTAITLIGQEAEDSALGGLLMRSVQVTHRRRA